MLYQLISCLCSSFLSGPLHGLYILHFLALGSSPIATLNTFLKNQDGGYSRFLKTARAFSDTILIHQFYCFSNKMLENKRSEKDC